jgi:putative addiction module killer protein
LSAWGTRARRAEYHENRCHDHALLTAAAGAAARAHQRSERERAPASKMKIDVGLGYRAYFVRRGKIIVVLLCGGDKSTQKKDIKLAKKLAGELED